MNLLNSSRVLQKSNSVPSRYFASKTLADIANVPRPPKKPLTPYFRFLAQSRSKIQAENPKFTVVEITKEIAKRWETVDEGTRQKLQEEYKKDKELYEKQYSQYATKLTPEMKESLKLARQEKQEIRERRLLKKRNRELEKPKRVASAFLRYTIEEKAKNKNIGNYQEYLKQLGQQWAQLSDAQKKPYQDSYEKDAAAYKVALEKWETKMLKEGNLDLVRSPLLFDAPVKTPKTASPTSGRSRKPSK